MSLYGPQFKDEQGNIVDLPINAKKLDGYSYNEYSKYYTTSSTTENAFLVTIPYVKALSDGLVIHCQFHAATKSGATLNVNSLGAKGIYYRYATAITTHIVANNYVDLIYSASIDKWVLLFSYDANSNTLGYQVRTNNGSYYNSASTPCYRYQMLVETTGGLEAFTSTSNSTGTSKTQLSPKYIPNGAIRYYSGTSTIASKGKFSATALWQQYQGINLKYSFNISTITTDSPCYIKMSRNTDGTLSPVYSATSGGHPLVFALPTTKDGYYYTYLGRTYTSSSVVYLELELSNPTFYYDGGIRVYEGATIPTKTSDLTNDSGYITGVDWEDVTGKPTFSTVATSGSYNDLTNQPTIPTKSSWDYDDRYVKYTATQSLTDTQKTQARTNIGAGTSNFTGYTSSNKLSTDYINNVAGWTSNVGTVTKVNNTSPDSNGNVTITVPTVNNGTLTIKGGTTSVTTFTANQSGNSTLNITAGSNVQLDTGTANTIKISATDTTYSSKSAVSGGTEVSLVTTGEKYTWDNKMTSLTISTHTSGTEYKLLGYSANAGSSSTVYSLGGITAKDDNLTVVGDVTVGGDTTFNGGKVTITGDLEITGETSHLIFGPTDVMQAIYDRVSIVYNSGSSTTKPICLSSGGQIVVCDDYAGGTAITLNGTSKAASTASFYAPTSVGTNGQLLSSNGSSLVWTNDNRGLLHHDLNVEIANTTTDSGWSMFNSTYTGYLLKSVRFNANSPAWGVGDFGAGIVFGGADTKGVISASWRLPKIKFAGGNSGNGGPVWWIGLTGTSETSYDLDKLTYAPTSAGPSGHSLKSNGYGAPRWAYSREVQLGASISSGAKNCASVTFVITNGATDYQLNKGLWYYSGTYGVFIVYLVNSLTSPGSPKTEYISGYVSSSIPNNTKITLIEL